MRMRYKRPAGSFTNFTNETVMSVNHGTTTRSIVHKDNTGDHDEVEADALNTTSQVTIFHEDAARWADLIAAWEAKEKLDLEWHTGVSGSEMYSQKAVITGMNLTAQVRESVTGQISFTHSGDLTTATVP